MRVRINKTVFWRKLSESYYLLQKNSEYCRVLNPTATFLWDLLAQSKPTSVEKLSLALAKEYDVSPKQANKDVEDFIKNYVREGILEVKK